MYDGLSINSFTHTAVTIPASRSRAIATTAFEFLFQHFMMRKFSGVFNDADATKREVVVASLRYKRLTQAVVGKAFSGKL
jgi:hypothetical protein